MRYEGNFGGRVEVVDSPQPDSICTVGLVDVPVWRKWGEEEMSKSFETKVRKHESPLGKYGVITSKHLIEFIGQKVKVVVKRLKGGE